MITKNIPLQDFAHLLQVRPNWRRLGPRFRDKTEEVVMGLLRKTWDMKEVVDKIQTEPGAVFEVTTLKGEEIDLSYRDLILTQLPSLPVYTHLIPACGFEVGVEEVGAEELCDLFLEEVQILRETYDVDTEDLVPVAWAGGPAVQRMMLTYIRQIEDATNTELQMFRYMLEPDISCDWFDLQIIL